MKPRFGERSDLLFTMSLVAVALLVICTVWYVIAHVPPEHVGSLGERCHRDGTCDGAMLICAPRTERDFVCVVRSEPKASDFESLMFCTNCADRCGDAGVKECLYSDTSVWGSKPATCVCR